MPIYRVTDVFGNVQRVRGPEGLTAEEVINLVESTGSGSESTEEILARLDRENVTLGERASDILPGIGRGLGSAVLTGLEGLAAALPEAYETPVAEGLEKGRRYLNEELLPVEPGLEDDFQTKFTAGLGSTIPFLAASAIGGPAAFVGGTAMGASMGAGEASRRARMEGATPEERSRAAALGILPGAAEILAPTAFARAAKALPVGEKVKLTKRIQRAFAAGGGEAAQEAAAEAAQNLIAQGIYKPDQEIIEGLGEAGAVGFSVGAFAQALFDMALRDRTRGSSTDTGPTQTDTTGTDETDEEVQPVLALPAPTQQAQPDLLDQLGTQQAQDDLVDQLGTQQAQDDEVQSLLNMLDMLDETGGGVSMDLEALQPQATTPPVSRERTTPVEPEPVVFSGLDVDQAQDIDELLTLLGAEAPTFEGSEQQALRLMGLDPAEVAAEQQKRKADIERRRGREELKGQKAEADLYSGLAEGVNRRRRRNEPAPVFTPEDARYEEAIDDILQEYLSQEGPPTPSADELVARQDVEGQRDLFPERLLEAQKARPATKTEPVSPLTPQILDTLGVPKTAAVYKRLTSKPYDLADVQTDENGEVIGGDLDVVMRELTSYAQQPAVPNTTKRRINALFGKGSPLQRDMFEGGRRKRTAEQVEATNRKAGGNRRATGEMSFEGKTQVAQKVPKKKVTTTEVAGDVEPDRDTVPVAEPTGRSTKDSVKTAGRRGRDDQRSAEGLKTVEQPDLDNVERDTPDTGAGKGRGTDPLKAKSKPESKVEPKPKAKVKPEPTPAPAPEPKAKSEPTPEPKVKGKSKKAVTQEVPKTVSAVPEGKDLSAPAYALLANEKLTTANVRREQGRGYSEKQAAKQYFVDYGAKERALDLMAYDYVNELTTEEISGGSSQNKLVNDAMSWVRKNLTESEVQFLDKSIAKYEKQGAFTEEAVAELSKELDKQIQSARAYEEYQGQVDEAKKIKNKDPLEASKKSEAALKRIKKENSKLFDEFTDLVGEELGFDEDPAVSIADRILNPELSKAAKIVGKPVDGKVFEALQRGDIRGALQALAKAEPDLAPIVRKFEDKLGDLSVEFTNEIDGYGEYVSGKNQVRFNSTTPLFNHTLLHEIAHALTVSGLRKKTPAARRIKKLYESVKPRLDEMGGKYAKLDVFEFTAEYFGNQDFRAELKNSLPPRTEGGNVLTRMFKAVANMLGFGQVQSQSELEALMDSILAPSPKTAANEVYAFDPSLVADKAGATIRQLNKRNAKATIGNSYDSLSTKGRTFVLGALRLPIVTEIARNVGLGDVANKIQNYVNQYEAKIEERNQLVTAATRTLSDWRKDATPEQSAAMEKLIYDSTTSNVSVLKPQSRYQGNPEKLAKYKELKKLYNSDLIGEKGREEYRKIQNNFDRMFRELISNIGATYSEDFDQMEKIRKSFLDYLTKEGGLDGYFPLMRKSTPYILKFEYIEDGKEKVFFDFFDSSVSRGEKIQEVEQAESEGLLQVKDIAGKGRFQMPTRLDLNTFEDAPKGTFVSKILENLKGTENLPKETKDKLIEDVLQLAIQFSPEASIIKSMAMRKNYEGYNRDYVEVYKDAMFGYATTNARLEVKGKLEQAKIELVEQTKNLAATDSEESRKIADVSDELLERIRLIQNPPTGFVNDLGNQVKTAGFLWTIGFNPSSALIDMASFATTIYPELVKQYGIKDSFSALAGAIRTYVSLPRSYNYESFSTKKLSDEELADLGISRDVIEAKAINSIDNLSPEQAEKLGLSELQAVMREKGQFNRWSLASDETYVGETKQQARINQWAGFMLQMTERMRRESTILAAYKLELKRLGKGKEREAAENAIFQSQRLNSPMSTYSGARYQQLPGWSVAYMYKSYGANILYLQLKTLNDLKNAIGARDSEAIKAYSKSLLMQYAAAGAVAGVAGMPFAGVIALLYDTFIADDDDEDFKTFLRKNIGDVGTYGLIDSFTDIKVADRVAMTNLIFRPEPNQEGDDLANGVMNIFGGPVFGTAERLQRSYNYFNAGNMQRGFENLLPAGFGNLVKTTRYSSEGVRTLKGDMVVDDLSGLSLAAQAIGFGSAEVQRTQEAISFVKRVERNRAATRKRLLDKAWISYRAGDFEAYAEALAEIREYNSEVSADDRIGLGSNGTLDKSFKSRTADLSKRVKGVLFKNEGFAEQQMAELGL